MNTYQNTQQSPVGATDSRMGLQKRQVITDKDGGVGGGALGGGAGVCRCNAGDEAVCKDSIFHSTSFYPNSFSSLHLSRCSKIGALILPRRIGAPQL